nr:C-C chemokine receptor type 8-like [Lytechinus pictus]
MSTSAATTMTTTSSFEENATCIGFLNNMITPEDCDFLTTASMVFIILSIILLIWGLLNNIILLIIIFTNGRKMRTIPNMFIGNMAFLGILYLVIVSGGNLPLFAQMAFQVRIIKDSSIPTGFFFVQMFVATSSFTILVILGLDRYLAIVHPLRSRPYRTKKRAVIANCFAWIIAGICMIPLFLGGGGSQDIFQVHSNPSTRRAMMVFMIFAFLLPLVLFFLMYLAILKVILHNPLNMQLQGEEQTRRWKQRIQIFKSISRVVLTFTVHYGYAFGIFLWLINGGHTKVSTRLSNVLFYSALLVTYLNTCINPLVYALTLESFRPFVYKLLCPNFCNLRRPQKGALNTTQQGDNPGMSVAHRTGQDNGISITIDLVSAGSNSDRNQDDNDISSNGIINQGYQEYSRSDGENSSENGSACLTEGEVIIVTPTSHE